MNVIESVKARIEDYRLTNKNPCKNYATKEAAEKAASAVATKVAKYFSPMHCELDQANYVVFYIEAWGRWVAAIDLTEMLRRPKSVGGYVGIASQLGFYSY